jgi:16S rRNA (uracil1498-N3)-methyltransferase
VTAGADAPRTAGPHFLIAPADHDAASAVIDGEDGRHLVRVLRAQPGDPVSLADGTGLLLQARVRSVSQDRVTLAIVERHRVPPPRPRLTVVHALPKGRKLDDVVQRLSEIGADRLVPVHSARSQVHLEGDRAAKALRRWRAVAHAAAKQSRRVRPLQVDEVGTWAEAFAGGAGVILWEDAATPLRQVLEALDEAEELTLGIGAEGGLTSAEVRASGLPAASLGPQVLRTETAGLVAATAVLYHLGRIG